MKGLADKKVSISKHNIFYLSREFSGEFKAFKLAQRSFYNEPCTIISGFKEKDFLSVVKETLLFQYNQRRKKERNLLDCPLTTPVTKCIIFIIETYIFQFKERKFYSSMLYKLDLGDLEAKISEWCDSYISDGITSQDLLGAIERMKGGNQKPGLDLLSEKRKKTYNNDLKSKLQKAINNQQGRSTFSKTEFKAFFIRYLLDAVAEYYNAEFDLLILLKVRYNSSLFDDIQDKINLERSALGPHRSEDVSTK